MSEPFAFPSTTTNFALPLLFSGQSQKEFFVNEALSLIDATLARTVTASQSAPPPAPAEGEIFRVTSGTAEWTDESDKLAAWIGGSWHFISPTNGALIFDQGAGVFLQFLNGWVSPNTLSSPQGGSVIDVEARNAIDEIIQNLRSFGLIDTEA